MIVATAGHVDHGKTSLIRHLTGVDTDRLAEEKRRGLTIDLGFAYRRINDEVTLGFIDVPGHSRFINNMIAGVSGIDLGMLVVAADDGPMPQTLEHLAVMRLLGISDFVLVLSKIDRVENGRVEEVKQAMAAYVPECEQAAFPVSNTSGDGIAELQDYLDGRALDFRGRSLTGNFRLSVDRAFSLRGVGLVVTGTAGSGRVQPGDELEVLPAGNKVRVRSLRVQDCEASRGQAGDRCALNIAGEQDIHRGSTLAAIDSLHCSKHLDARFTLLANAPYALKHLTPVKLYIGTRRLACRLYFIDFVEDSRLSPGGNALVQLILAEPVVASCGDRFLIRDDSESITLGGGVVLDPFAPKTGKAHGHRIRYLAAMESSSVKEALTELLQPGFLPLNVSQFCQSWNLVPEELEQLFDGVTAVRFEVDAIKFAMSPEDWAEAEKTLLSLVQKWQGENPQREGLGARELQTRFATSIGSVGSEYLFKAVIGKLLRAGSLVLAGGLVKSAGYKSVLSAQEESHWAEVERALRERGLMLPLLSELAVSTGLALAQVRKVLQAAARINQVHKLNDNRFGLAENLREHASIVAELARHENEITVINYKNRLGTGRKLAIEILEYFDALRYTQRRGASRVIIDDAVPGRVLGK